MQSDVVVLRFPPPNNPLSINQANRMHWAAKKRYMDPWKSEVWAAWMGARSEHCLVKDKPCTVEVHLPFRTAQRRDPHNYTGTMVKAIVDSLVRSGVWPDDTAEWVTVLDPVLKIGGDCLIVITTR